MNTPVPDGPALAARDGEYADAHRPYDIYARVFRFAVASIRYVQGFPGPSGVNAARPPVSGPLDS